ncbi:MAG: hypothetical protein BAJALOKI1v1_140032 [Promethearchaeota archaeon]|nr:MAG: hypothetical protein BAJALOKI1v1_140032 [Candidatus Lokiarchaeota archaeon]
MGNILEYFQGKLYRKETIEKWNLPIKVQEKLNIEENKYYFLTISPEEERHGHENHIHLCLYPTKSEPVYLIEVETPVILPELLHKCLELIKENTKNIITTTGFCKSKELCYFGIFFSILDPNEVNLDELIADIKKVEKVNDANIFKYTCEGSGEA